MVQINWGLATGPNSFDNALAKGYQMGSAMRERQEATERKNALAAYATNPNEQNFAGLAQADPALAIKERERRDTATAKQAEQRRADLPMVLKLIETAVDEPTYQRNRAIAQQYGLDTSKLPPNFDPQWREQNLATMKLLVEDADNLPGLAQEVLMALPPERRDPNSPEFRQAYIAALENKYATEYTAPDGTTRRRTMLNLGGPQSNLPRVSDEAGYNALPPGAEYIAPDGTPRRKVGGAPQMGAKLTDDQASAIMMRAAQTGTLSASDAAMLAGTLGANGDSAFNQWVRANNIRIGN